MEFYNEKTSRKVTEKGKETMDLLLKELLEKRIEFKTGVSGLDNLLEGGMPPAYINAVYGSLKLPLMSAYGTLKD
jgi:RecA/RadA recombinase